MAVMERSTSPVLPACLPPSREERWALLDAFLAAWFPESPTPTGLDFADLETAERRLALRFPPALREWYGLYGARTDVWSLQDELWLPRRIRVEEDVLTFCTENQGVVRWGIRVDDLHLEDPPVLVSEPGATGQWIVESESTTAFALQFAVRNAKWSRRVRHRANGEATQPAIQAIERIYRRLPFPDAHWPVFPTRFYAGEDVLIEVNAETWLWVTALSRAALDRVDSVVRAAGGSWEVITTE
jgi:hypothetical protein